MSYATLKNKIERLIDKAGSGNKELIKCIEGGATNIVLPKGVTKIKNYAFYYDTTLTSITIPDSVTSIAPSAFRDCTNLTDIYVSWSEGEVADAPWGATNATIHYNSTGEAALNISIEATSGVQPVVLFVNDVEHSTITSTFSGSLALGSKIRLESTWLDESAGLTSELTKNGVSWTPQEFKLTEDTNIGIEFMESPTATVELIVKGDVDCSVTLSHYSADGTFIEYLLNNESFALLGEQSNSWNLPIGNKVVCDVTDNDSYTHSLTYGDTIVITENGSNIIEVVGEYTPPIEQGTLYVRYDSGTVGTGDSVQVLVNDEIAAWEGLGGDFTVENVPIGATVSFSIEKSGETNPDSYDYNISNNNFVMSSTEHFVFITKYDIA